MASLLAGKDDRLDTDPENTCARTPEGRVLVIARESNWNGIERLGTHYRNKGNSLQEAGVCIERMTMV